ncbi:MAG: type II toxin-antitoxin system VapC family toxin [Desulfuromusa sp.]|jgi:tRNA(fMet)-specific endonuclease VapC|nr:type II toxin-antitoxin system VapC family toxin [Desulfuromusa sp.]
MYLLDSNVCIHLLNEKSSEIEKNFRSHSPADIFLCSVIKAELLYGARHSQRVSDNLQRLKLFFAPLGSIPFDDRCAEEYGLVRSALAEQGKIIGPNDMLIAAIARANDATLITHNTREFGRVPSLKLEDWEVN